MPTAILNWALDSAVFTVFLQLVKPKLDICAISTAVYLRSFLVAHLVSVWISTQWIWSISATAFTHSCKNPAISFLQTIST